MGGRGANSGNFDFINSSSFSYVHSRDRSQTIHQVRAITENDDYNTFRRFPETYMTRILGEKEWNWGGREPLENLKSNLSVDSKQKLVNIMPLNAVKTQKILSKNQINANNSLKRHLKEKRGNGMRKAQKNDAKNYKNGKRVMSNAQKRKGIDRDIDDLKGRIRDLAGSMAFNKGFGLKQRKNDTRDLDRMMNRLSRMEEIRRSYD